MASLSITLKDILCTIYIRFLVTRLLIKTSCEELTFNIMRMITSNSYKVTAF